MQEDKVRALLEQLYLHVAAMPWKDQGFVRSEVAQQAAKDHIVETITKQILELEKESKNA